MRLERQTEREADLAMASMKERLEGRLKLKLLEWFKKETIGLLSV